MNFHNTAWRRKPVVTAYRTAASLVRRRFVHHKRAIVRYRGGRVRIFADLRTSIGLHLYRYGYDDPDLSLVTRILSPGDVFVDGGANIGLFSLAAAERVGPTGKVIAFEPSQDTHRVLKENVQLNAFHWLEVHQLALADKPGQGQFVAFSGSGSGHSSFAPSPELQGGHLETVEIVALDDVIDKEDRARLRLIKLDLEGAEYLAVQGAINILADVRPDVVVEIEPQHLLRQSASATELLKTFEQLGYQSFKAEWDQEGKLLLRQERVSASADSSPNFFLTTDVRRVQDAGIAIKQA